MPRLARCAAWSASVASGWHCPISRVRIRRSSTGSTPPASSTRASSIWSNPVIRGAAVRSACTCAELSVPARNAAATPGRLRSARAVPTIPLPVAGLSPVAVATSIPVLPARRLRARWAASAVPANWTR